MNEYNVVDCGDVSYEPTIKSSFLENATNMVERLARDGASILSLGGDHMSTEPLMKGLHRVYGGGWGLIDIDAHADLIAVDDDALDEHTCGNMFYLALKDGFLDPKKTFQLGLRTEEDLAQDKWARDLGVSQIDVFECEDLGPVKIAEMILEAVGDSKVIMTMDIDGFDPGECGGGQASPHPGGLRFNWVRRMLQAMKGINVVGADFVEIDPVKDMESRTSTNVAVIILNDMAHLMGLARKKRGTKC